MVHYPVNHHLRPLYRFLAGLIGLFYVVSGVLGAAASWGDPVFDRGDVWVLGQRTNLAWSILAVLIGLVILAAVAIGGNTHHWVNLRVAWALLVLGIAAMAVLQTDVNVLNFSMANVITCLVLGLLLLTAGLYGRVQAPGEGHTEPGARHEPVSNVKPEQLPRPARDIVER